MTITNDTLESIKLAQQNATVARDLLGKSFTQASGLVFIDLEASAKTLYPVITPLRNQIPRVPGRGGTATNWKAITGININGLSLGVSEGRRGGVIATAVQNFTAAYKGYGLEDSVTFEADYAAQGFDNLRLRATEGLLRAVMIGEEKLIVGGNQSLALGITPTPTLSDVATGGSLAANNAVSVVCVALSFEGYLNASVAAGVPAQVARTNADGTSDSYGGGSARKSAAASVTTANDASATHAVRASVAAVNGASAYAWFWGAAGSETLGAITTINSVLIAAPAAGTQTAASLPAADNSQNGLVFDGLLTQIQLPGSNSYVFTMPTGTPGVGTPLTADGAGGIVEIDAALKSFWDNFRLSPDLLLVSSQELLNITRKVIAGGGAPLFRFNLDGQQGSPATVTATAGAIVGSYLNKYTMSGGQLVQIMLHPNVPPGTIVFYSRTIPYPLSNVSNILQMKLRQDYYQLEWPMQTRQYQYGVYADGVLQNYFPPAFGIIRNIANG